MTCRRRSEAPASRGQAERGRALRGIVAAALMGLLVAGCELPDWLGESEGPPLPGERISVLSLDESLEPDPGISDVSVQLPQPWRNRAWPDAAGYPTNAMYHLEAGKDLKRAWRVDIGAGSGGEERLLARPIVAEGHIYTMDAETTVSAFDVKTGDRLWERDLRAEHESSGALGGGVAYDGGRLFVTTGYGHVYALEPASGKVIWDHKVGVPMRAPPLAADSRVFAITYDNQLFTLLQEDGREMWTHTGLPEDASLLGAPTAAATGDVVVVPYTSGELFALRVENGSGLWSDQLVRAARSTPLAALNEIRGAPVIDRNLVIAISHSGRMAAIDLRTGQRQWDRDIEGVQTPWVAGDFIYLVTTRAEVVCLSRRDGRIRWVRQLERYKDPKDRKNPIEWVGPVLISDRLVVAGSNGYAVSVSPYTGKILGRIELPDAVRIAPVVADGTLYFLTDDADLIAYR